MTSKVKDAKVLTKDLAAITRLLLKFHNQLLTNLVQGFLQKVLITLILISYFIHQ